MIKRILMVDDDTDDADVFKLMVKAIDPGIEVVIAIDGNRALEALVLLKRPDLIFLDSVMPGMDGIECLTKIKANRNTRNIPVVMYTSLENVTETQLALRLGAASQVQKISDIDKLTEHIRQVIDVARASK